MAPGEPPELEDYLQLMSALLALGIFVIAFLSWRRRPTTRTTLVTVAFALLVVRGAFHVLSDFLVREAVGDLLERAAVALEAAFLVAIAAAFLKA